jgi:acid phosphatase type 7
MHRKAMRRVTARAFAAGMPLLLLSSANPPSVASTEAAASDSTLASLGPVFQTGRSFIVTWGGSTDNQSGVASYSVSVRRAPFNGSFGPWEPFKKDVLVASVDPVVAAAGDIACGTGHGTSVGHCQEMKTSDLLVQVNPDVVLPLGDTQYENGAYDDYFNGTPGRPGTGYDPTWGRLKSVTRPVVGNHEYNTSGAAGYFDYFNGIGNFSGPAGDRDKGYYSFDVGNWHVIALNSNCASIGLCTPGSPQYQWLSADLAAHQNSCTLAYWHAPLFSSGGRAATNTAHFWQLLHEHGADVILNGHDHIYERFAPQSPTGVFDPTQGIRQFTVGTGGKNLTDFAAIEPNSEVRDNTSFGVLKLTLRPKSYDWEFVPITGQTFRDSGSDSCHRFTRDTTAPTAPTMGGANSVGSATFVGEPGFTYCFRATATDWEGNTSEASNEYCTAVPVDNISFKHWGGWAKKRGAGYYLGSFSQTRNLGATLTLKNVTAKHLAVIVTTCPRCGALRVFFGGKLVSRIQLRSPTTTKMRMISVKTFDTPQTGTVKVRVSSRGKLVRVEGLGVSAV